MTTTQKIIDKLKKFFLKDLITKDIAIFLCGGASKEQAQFRFRLGKKLQLKKSKYIYSVYYPETLFSELLLGHNPTDLLSLENFLAESVNSVVIPLQSVGTFTELGAFANHPKLKDKLTVIIDPNFRYSKSFINDGPIKMLQQQTNSKILYQTMEIGNIDKLSYKISEAARDIANKIPLAQSVDNPLIAIVFYLSLVYVFDPIDKELFLKIVSSLTSPDNKYTSKTILASVMSHGTIKLQKNRKLSFIEDGFESILEHRGYNINQINQIKKQLSDFRVDAINQYYRKRGVYFRGEVYNP